MTKEQPRTAPEEAAEKTTPSEELSSMQTEVAADFDPSQIDVQNFVIDGQVDFESVERFKDVISASDLEILNQLRPGILFDLFVEPSGDQFTINFGSNDDADAHIGLSQILRGHSSKYESGTTPLEAIRVLLVQETEGEVHESTRDGLGGNFYEANNAYQEVHNGYTIEISQESDQAVAQMIEIREEAEEAVKGITLRHPRLMRLDRDTAPEISHFDYNERKDEHKYKKKPQRRSFLEYMYTESRMQGVDPEVVLAIVDASYPSGSVDFENEFQWTLRTIKAHEKHYESITAQRAQGDNDKYTAEFITYLINTGDEMMANVNRDRFQKMYGKVSDQKFEWTKSEQIQPLLAVPRDIEAPGRQGMMNRLVGYEHNRMSSGYGQRWDPVEKRKGNWVRAGHRGIDIGAPTGAPIYSAADGVVIRSEFQGGPKGAGWFLSILHADGFVTQYLHCSEILSRYTPGARVSAGEQIAKVGSTGKSTGPHLHFEAFSLKNVDPADIDLNDINVKEYRRKIKRSGNRDYVEPFSYLSQLDQITETE